jgi:protein involved in polysaccharide export with SLBB domain
LRGAMPRPFEIMLFTRCCAASIALLMTAGFAAPTLGQSPAPAFRQSPSDATLLQAGDVVRITVWRKPELSGEFVVAPDGSLTHPLYRTVRVTDVPFPTVEQRVLTFLARFEENPQFVVEPLLRVSVGGEVHRPNLYNLRPETSISQAVAIAGGATERGRSDEVYLFRAGTQQVLNLTTAGGRLPIRSGDEIMVGRRRAFFREVVAPVIGVIGAAAAVANVVRRN